MLIITTPPLDVLSNEKSYLQTTLKMVNCFVCLQNCLNNTDKTVFFSKNIQLSRLRKAFKSVRKKNE